MSDHRIGALRLHLRTTCAPGGDLRSEARAFAEALLAAVAERVDRRAGGRVVRVRALPLRLRAGRELFRDRAEIERIAEDLAAALPLDAPGDGSWDERDVVVFDDEPARRAAHLAERAAGRAPSWCFADLAADPDGAAGLISARDRSLAEATLARLAAAGARAAVLGLLSEAARAGLVELLGLPAPDGAAAALAHGAHAPGAPPPMHRHAAAIRASFADRAVSPPATPGPPASRPEEAPRPRAAGEDAAAVAEETRHAGLAYLVSCLLELEAGEILWRACVHEPSVIAAALSSLIAGAGDPAPERLAGVAPGSPFDVTGEQRAEIVASLAAALAGALPRRGLAAPPDLTLSFGDAAGGRLLVARAFGAHLVFAAPAALPADAQAAIAALLSSWPGGAVLAPPPIAELDPSGRIRPIAAGSPGTAPPALPPARSLDAAIVAAATAGAAATLFQARAGERSLAGPGRFHDEADARIVTLPMTSIRMPVRRAGLDRDPGWVPWLGRHVRIQFGES